MKRAGAKGSRGFTLIELMIVLSILAILMGVALPAYQRYIVRATRADAQGALLGFAQAMERHYQQNYTYAGATAGGGGGAPAANVFPSQAPIDGTPFYNLTINSTSVSANGQAGFVLRATPIAGTRQNGDGFLQLDSLGVRSWDRDNSGAISDDEQTWDE